MLLTRNTEATRRAPAGPLQRAALALACLGACMALGCPGPNGDDDEGSCTLPFLGDPNQDIEMVVLQRNAAGELQELSDGGQVDLVLPPQGGRVLFVGARATNIDPCEVRISGAVRDTDSGQVRLDTRVVNLTVDGAFGSNNALDISSLSNVPMCPNQWSARDVFDEPYELTIKLQDRAGRTAETIVQVTPSCAEPDNAQQCLCICKQGYVLGETCE